MGLLFFGLAKAMEAAGFWRAINISEPRGFLVEGFLFLGLFWVLGELLFDPYLRVLQERHDQTKGKQEQASLAQKKTEQLLATVEHSQVQAWQEAQALREEIRTLAHRQEKETLAQTQRRAKEEFKTMVQETQKELARARASLDSSAQAVAQEIVQTVSEKS